MRIHAGIVWTVGVAALAFVTPAQADPTTCQEAIARQLQKFKKIYLKSHVKCLRLENLGRIGGPCPNQATEDKIDQTTLSVTATIAAACSLGDASSLGFPSDCAFEAATTGAEGDCADPLQHPVTTPEEFAQCLECWKAAEMSEFVALLFASHAQEECGGALDDTSTRCSDLDCTTPLPNQTDLVDSSENDCQTGIAKAGINYLLKREKILEKCALAGGTQTSCLDPMNLAVAPFLAKAGAAKETLIRRKCGNNRVPTASPPFCCRTGTQNDCDPTLSSPVATPQDCTAVAGHFIMENKTCNAMTLNCDSVMGPNKPITWWETCPEGDTCTATLATLDDLITCVDTSADTIANELLCFQFPRNTHLDWPCPTDVP